MDVRGKRVLVVGLARSGVAAALFLREQAARVTISDAKAEPELAREIPALLDRGIVMETGGHGELTFRDQDLIVISPGVPVNAPLLQQAREQGIRVIGEVELAFRFLQGPVIAITGSNGKTTTTTLCGEILAAAGMPVQVGGNIGTPVSDLIGASEPSRWNVLEISSFQLETVETFRPRIAAVLNVTPDHLDRHGSFEVYAAAKARIFEFQNSGDFAVLNADDKTCIRMAAPVRSQVFWFSRHKEIEQGAYLRGDQIVFRRDEKPVNVLPSAEIPLKGAHNLENVLAAVCISMLAGCSPDSIRKAVAGFRAVEHRLEHVATVAGVAYFNDSKATNVDATIKAVESFPAGIHLILGGKDKGSDYTVLDQILRERVKRVYLIGAAAPMIESQIGDAAPVSRAGTLEKAVRLASEAATPGDIVLLAPACSSFDQFDNYQHRGRVFKQLVTALKAGAEAKPRG